MRNARIHTHQIATSANGKLVYADLTQQPLSGILGREPRLLGLIDTVLSNFNLTSDAPCIEQDMGKQIGYSSLLEITEKDVVFYAKQTRSDTYTKFVKNRQRTPTNFITICLSKDETGDYELLDVNMGKKVPAVPGTEDETANSRAYWENHAVVYDGQSIIANSLVKTSPY